MELNELLKEINLARTNPKGYANKLIYQMSYLSKGDDKIILPSQEVINIKEGFGAYHEGINYLRLSLPLPPVILNVPLSLIAVNEASKQPINADDNRFKRYGAYDSIGEITFITQAVLSIDHESIVTQLLVSDGDNARTNRSMLLNPDFNMIGLGKWRYDSNKLLIKIIFAKNWKITHKTTRNEEDNEEWHYPFRYSQEDKESNVLKEIENYEKTLNDKINNEYQYVSVDEERKLFKDNDKFKLIKQFHLILDNNVKKDIVISKSFFF